MKVVKQLFGIEPFPNTRRGKSLTFLWTSLILLAASIEVGMIVLRLSAVKYEQEMFKSYFQVPNLVTLNILPIILITFLLWFLFGRAAIALAIPSVAAIVLVIINMLKIRLRNDPLLFEDLLLAPEAGNIAGQYNLSLDAKHWKSIFTIGIIILLVAIVTRSHRLNRKRGWGKVRLVWFIVLAVVTGGVWTAVYLNSSVYQSTQNDYVDINHYSAVDEFQSRGFIYPFLYSYTSSIDPPPDGYNKNEAKALLAEYEDADIPEQKKVNVISVMLEAYCDLSKLIDNEQITEVYERLHEIEDESVSGRLISNVFVGGTNQTERCFLTGYSHLGSFRSPSYSYPRYFRSQGYTVEGSHPGYKWFYNRENINKNLGFENYYFWENYYSNTQMKEESLILDSDAVFFPSVVNFMKDSIEKTGKPYFSFHVSYQNHGPYGTDWMIRPDEIYVTPEDTGWSQESCTILNNYLGNIADTTKHIQETLETLEDYEEPVVFVAFGDHLPWLGDNQSVYNEIGVNISENTTEGYLNHYCTPFFIWANSAAKETLDNDFVGDAGYLSPNFLMNELFDQCGWDGDAYMQYTRTVREVSSMTGEAERFLIDGQITDTPPEEAKKVFQQFDCVQYYHRKNFEG